MIKFFTCLASLNKLLGTGDSGLTNLEDWYLGPEVMGLEKDEELEAGLVRGGEKERGDRRVSMSGAEEKQVDFFLRDGNFLAFFCLW